MNQSIRNIIREGRSNSANETQKQEYLSLFHQPDIEFELKNQLLTDLNETEATNENKHFFDELFEKMWRKRRLEISGHRQKNHLVLRLAQLAAILVIGLFFGYFINSTNKVSSPLE